MKTWVDNQGTRTVQLASGQLASLDRNGVLDVAGTKISREEIEFLYEKVRAREAEERRQEQLYGY